MSLPITNYINEDVISLIKLALSEDLGPNNLDITSTACLDPELIARARIVAKQSGTVFGNQVAAKVFEMVNSKINYQALIDDGAHIGVGDIIAEIEGPFLGIVTGERTALNFLQRLSAVSSITKQVVERIRPFTTKVLDTRKTTPGYRALEKAAVLAGGGHNHRLGLYDEFIIKNNHVDALNGDVAEAIRRCRKYLPSAKLKVEVRDDREIAAALGEKPDGILFDNFEPNALEAIVKKIRINPIYKDIRFEASGGITIENCQEFAKSGVDEISLGFLTHSAKSLDISLRYTE